MRSCNSYQDIKTPEDMEFEARVDAIFADLCDEYADEIAEKGMDCYQKTALMNRARWIARDRMRKEEGENEK